jgi:hypothetical protein
MITMKIAATRMHRSLVDYASGSPDAYDTLQLPFLFILLSASNVQFSVLENLEQAARTASISPPNRIEVTVHKSFEQHSTAQMSGCIRNWVYGISVGTY